MGIEQENIISIRLGAIFHEDAPKYNKTWIVHPVLVEVATDKIKLDWEAQNYQWVTLKEVKNFNLLPGFDRVLEFLFNKNLP
jgi:hypothetical protein